MQAVAQNDVKIQIHGSRGNTQLIDVGISHVEFHLTGMIQKNADPVLAVHNEEIVSRIQAAHGFGLVWFVCCVAGIDPAPLVDAPDILAQTVDHIFPVHFIAEPGFPLATMAAQFTLFQIVQHTLLHIQCRGHGTAIGANRKIGQRRLFFFDLFHHRFGAEGLAEGIFTDHLKRLSFYSSSV